MIVQNRKSTLEKNRESTLRLSQRFLRRNVSRRDETMEGKMNWYFWPADHPAVLLALVATATLVFAWPLENVPACVLAAVMMVAAAGIAIRAHFHSVGMG
jgi:hypothetical protein